jgi:L-alanine-DL-glutamate epimerase-like enolase superfamily enzyme
MEAKAYLLSFPVDFKIARSRILYSHHVVVTLEAGDYRAAGSGVLYRSTGWQVGQLWQSRLRPSLEALTLEQVAANGWPACLDGVVAAEPGLAFAADAALWDLKGKVEGRPVADLLGEVQRTSLPVTEQIFISNWSQSEQELRQILARGTTRLKVKTGAGLAQDVALIGRVREMVGPDVELRVDANRAYTLAEAAGMYRELAALGVLAAEEPLRESWPALRQFRETVGLPVMLDESILSLSDLRQAIEAQAIDSLNIKLTRVGGLSQALTYSHFCQAAGVAVSLGCNEDLGPGMAAILHFAAAVPYLYSMEGLGNLRLGVDLIDERMAIKAGQVALPAGPGLGVQLANDWMERLNGRARVFDLNQSAHIFLRAYSTFARTHQRATNLLYRLSH